jgi:hypothetical protein
VAAVDNGDGVQWRQWGLHSMAVAVFDGIHGIRDGLRQGDGKIKMAGTPKGREGGARQGNATTSWRNERTRGQHNERTARDDATTNWRTEMTSRRHNKTA